MSDYAYLFQKKEVQNESYSESIFTAILTLAMFIVLAGIIYMLPHAL